MSSAAGEYGSQQRRILGKLAFGQFGPAALPNLAGMPPCNGLAVREGLRAPVVS